MTKKNGFLFSKIAGLALLSACFGSCLKSSSGTTSSASVSTYISVLNMAPYAPPVDVLFNGTQASQDVIGDTYFNSYSAVGPGTYNVKFIKSGLDSLVAEIPSYTFDTVNFYTLLLYNPTHDSTKAITIHDDFSNVTNVYSYYRFYNMNPDAGAVDLYLAGTQAQSNRKPADNVKSISYNLFQSIQPGYYSVIIKAAGTDSLITSATSVDLSPGNVYTFLLNGKGTNSQFNVLRGNY